MKRQSLVKAFFLFWVCVYIFSLTSCETDGSPRKAAAPPAQEEQTSAAAARQTPAPAAARQTTAADYKGKIIISELCARNSAGIRDAAGAFSDWIEISNLSQEAVLLTGLYLSDDPQAVRKYEIPPRTLEAGACLLLFAGGVQAPQTGELRVPFAFSAQGETITLSAEDGGMIDRVTYASQAEGKVLYKNKPDEPLRETFYATPGYPNTDAGYEAYCSARKAAGPLVISELAVTNDTLLPQSDGRYYDWVELKNVSGQAVCLRDYGITDKIDKMKYDLPDIVLPAGGYFVLICSGTEKTDGSGYRHAGFSLNAEAETLYLYEKQTHTPIDWVSVQNVPPGATYGRQDGAGGFFYFTAPSPGGQNTGGVRKVSEAARSTLPAGVYETFPCTVGLEADGTIYYTTDGSAPDRTAHKYTKPLCLTRSTVLRTVVYEAGKIPSRIKTYSYLADSAGTLPVLSLVTDPDHLWSEETGIYVKGKYNNYYQDWEREASLAYFENGAGFELGCGLKMNGSGSRESDAKKSFKVNFRGKYGQSELEYDLFGNGVTVFDSLVLRAGEDYPSSIFRNELFTTFARRYFPSLLAQAGKYCSLYINGEYFGIYYLQERLNERYYAEHFGVPEESVTVSEYIPSKDTDLYRVMEFCRNHDMRKAENYRYVQQNIDLESMTDWFILEAYSGNTDVIQNIRYMKSDADGGRWKWALYDLDWAFYFHNNAFESLLTESLRETNRIIRPLLKNSEYRTYFLERLAYHIEYTLRDENILAIIEEYETLLAPEIGRERALWGGSRAGWELSVARLKAFVTEHDRCGELVASISGVLQLTEQEIRKYFG